MEKVVKIQETSKVKDSSKNNPYRNFNCKRTKKSKSEEEYDAYFCEMLRRKKKSYQK